MKNKLFLIFLGISGFLQLLSISFDQYVIQKENQIRNIDNEISILNDQIDQMIASNISFGRFSYSKILQVREILWGENKESYNIDTLRFLNNEHLDKVKSLIYNKYLPVYEDYKPNEIYNEIEELLDYNSLEINRDDLDAKFLTYQEILDKLYHSVTSVKNDRNLKNKLQKELTEKKFMFLVLGMMCNIASIFFLFMFFYAMIRNDNLKLNVRNR